MTLCSRLKTMMAFLLCAVGVPALSRRLHRRQLTIVMFHGVEDDPLSPPCEYVHNTPALRQQLKYLRRHFAVLPLEEALERLYDGTLPDHAAAITFDDGTRNLLTHAAPVLREFGLPAAVFLVTGLMGTKYTIWADRLWLAFARTASSDADLTELGLGTIPLRSADDRASAFAATVEHLKNLPDSERLERFESLVVMLDPEVGRDSGAFSMLSWDEARALAGDGSVTLHPHTVTHPILSQCSDEKVKREIVESCAAIEYETGRMPTVFAYPNGRPQDFDHRAKDALRSSGVRWALATVNGRADGDSDPLALPRIGVGGTESFSKFRLVVSGALPWRRKRPLRRGLRAVHGAEVAAAGALLIEEFASSELASSALSAAMLMTW